MVLQERENGVQKIFVRELKGGQSHSLVFPETLYSISPGDNRVWDTNKFRYTYQSFTTPKSVVEHDLELKIEQQLHQQKVMGEFDRNNYVSERRYAKADDQTFIPISLVYKKTTRLDGTAPLHLIAYGAYGSSARTRFSSDALSLLDRGVILAVAHVRGGGDLGQAWHDGGRLFNKKNTFSDFIRCAETLIADKYTNTNHLVIEGRSAGGLLMGAVVNMRPDLFKAVLSQVPFVDVLNTMLDPSLPLVVGEYEEWGNPTVLADYNNIKAYSPYDNLKPGKYPTILVKTALNDSQVMYWEPAKYVAKLRTMKRDSNPLLFVTDMNSGHGGASGKFEEMRERAFDYAFILRQMGIDE
jgi:oligopeptidase B